MICGQSVQGVEYREMSIFTNKVFNNDAEADKLIKRPKARDREKQA